MKKAISAGGVVIKDGKIIFVMFPSGNGITFPKGHVEKGESFEETALREVREETGYKDLRIIEKLGVVIRPAIEKDGTNVVKDVHLFLMEIVSDVRGKADEETIWLTPNEAMSRLFPQEAEFLKKVRNLSC